MKVSKFIGDHPEVIPLSLLLVLVISMIVCGAIALVALGLLLGILLALVLVGAIDGGFS